MTRLRVVVAALQAKNDSLNVALTSNRIIGAAIGLVMAEYHLDLDAAFAVLVRLSKSSNQKLNQLAADLVATHHDGLTSVGAAIDLASAAGLAGAPESRG